MYVSPIHGLKVAFRIIRIQFCLYGSTYLPSLMIRQKIQVSDNSFQKCQVLLKKYPTLNSANVFFYTFELNKKLDNIVFFPKKKCLELTPFFVKLDCQPCRDQKKVFPGFGNVKVGAVKVIMIEDPHP